MQPCVTAPLGLRLIIYDSFDTLQQNKFKISNSLKNAYDQKMGEVYLPMSSHQQYKCFFNEFITLKKKSTAQKENFFLFFQLHTRGELNANHSYELNSIHDIG